MFSGPEYQHHSVTVQHYTLVIGSIWKYRSFSIAIACATVRLGCFYQIHVKVCSRFHAKTPKEIGASTAIHCKEYIQVIQYECMYHLM